MWSIRLCNSLGEASPYKVTWLHRLMQWRRKFTQPWIELEVNVKKKKRGCTPLQKLYHVYGVQFHLCIYNHFLQPHEPIHAFQTLQNFPVLGLWLIKDEYRTGKAPVYNHVWYQPNQAGKKVFAVSGIYLSFNVVPFGGGGGGGGGGGSLHSG